MDNKQTLTSQDIHKLYSNLTRNVIDAYKNNFPLPQKQQIALSVFEKILTVEKWTYQDKSFNPTEIEKIQKQSDLLRKMVHSFFQKNTFMDSMVANPDQMKSL